MRIAFPLINLSAHGGVRILVELGNALAERGATVEFIVPKGKDRSPYALHRNVTLRRIGLSTPSKRFDYLLFLLLIPFYLRRKLVIANFFVTFMPALLASRLLGAKYLYYVQDMEDKYSGLSSVLNLLCRLSYRSHRMIAANRFIADALNRRFGAKPLAVSHLGPSAAFFLAEHAAEKRYDVMLMARREPWKGLDRAMAWLDQGGSRYQVLCVGQDQELLAEMSARGLHTAKPANDAELSALYDSSRVFYFTSLREGFGLPPLEAMARGVPCVLHRNGGSDLYVEDGSNALYVDDVASVDQAITQLIEQPALVRQLVSAGTRTADSLRLSSALQELAELMMREAGQAL